jgi:putative ABC transport system permease protein
MPAHFRTLIKAPAFTLMAIVLLALGLGISTAFFNIVDGVLLEPLPFRDAGRIMALHTAWPAKGTTVRRVTGGDFQDVRSVARSFSNLAFYEADGEGAVRIGGDSRFAHVVPVSPAFFSVLGAPFVAGRLPGDSDAEQTAIVSASFARSAWGDPALALGKTLGVDNKSYSIIGVVSGEYVFPEHAEVWLIGAVAPQNLTHTAYNHFAIGRLQSEASQSAAQQELNAISAQLPGEAMPKQLQLISLRDQTVGSDRTTLLFLFAGTALLLCIACANVANLCLARASGRMSEFALRLSLGSSTARLIGNLALEGVILATSATALGLAMSWAVLRAIYSFLPPSIPRAANVLHMHLPVLLFAAGIAVFIVVVCSIVPALHLIRLNVAGVLKQSGRGLVGVKARVRHGVVSAQVAICFVLLIGAGLLTKTVIALKDSRLGFKTDNVLVADIDTPASSQAEYLRVAADYSSLVEQVRRVPGVRATSLVFGLPTGQYGSNGNYFLEGVHIQPGQDPFKIDPSDSTPTAIFALAGEGYFKTLGIPLLAGRDFDATDLFDRPFTAIISKSLAEQSFGGASPLGRRLYCGLDSPKPMTIVGVVGDVRQDSPSSAFSPQIYMPFRQHPSYANSMQLVVLQEVGSSVAIEKSIREIVQSSTRATAVQFHTFSAIVGDSIAGPEFRAMLSLLFAAIAGLLAMSGVHAVMAYSVSQSIPDIGIRMALGANRASIVRMVLMQALTMTAIGLVAGGIAAFALSRSVETLVYGVRASDPMTYVLSALLVFAAMTTAVLGPVRRASQVDPMNVLRND